MEMHLNRTACKRACVRHVQIMTMALQDFVTCSRKKRWSGRKDVVLIELVDPHCWCPKVARNLLTNKDIKIGILL